MRGIQTIVADIVRDNPASPGREASVSEIQFSIPPAAGRLTFSTFRSPAFAMDRAV